MDKKYVSLKFNAKIKPLEKLNEEFTLCKVYVQGVGKNRNFSYMSKESILKNLHSLNYAPVVGHLIKKDDGSYYMGGHDYEITEDWEYKSLTVPYGVVKNDTFDFEFMDEYGVQVEYLTAHVILWTARYPELMDAIYNDDFYFNQSMELNLDNGNYRPYDGDSNYTELLDWTYSALCLLGKADDRNSEEHTEPCFISSKVIPIQESFSQNKFSSVMEDMKKELALYFNNQPSKDVDIENLKEGGHETLAEELNENIEEVIDTVEEEVVNPVNEEEIVTPDTIEEVTEEESSEFNNETVEGDEPVVETIEKSEYDKLHDEFEDYKKNYSTPNSEVQKLVEFQTKVLKDVRETEEKDVFDRFEDKLGSVDEFAKLKSNCSELTIEEIEEKCFCMVGKLTATFSTKKKKDTVVKIPVEFSESTEEDPYGGILASKYNK